MKVTAGDGCLGERVHLAAAGTAALLRATIAESEARAGREVAETREADLPEALAEARRPAWQRWLGWKAPGLVLLGLMLSPNPTNAECQQQLQPQPFMPPDYYLCAPEPPPPDPYGETPDAFGTTAWQWGWKSGHGLPLAGCLRSWSEEHGKSATQWEQRWGAGCATGRIDGGRNTWLRQHPGWSLPDTDG